MRDAIQSSQEGVLIKVHVTSGASRSGYGGYDEWRKCVKLSVIGQPRRGEANKEIVSMVSNWFGLDESSIEIVSGLKERSKTVLVRGIGVERAMDALSGMEEK